MITKENDKLYCGVDREKIKTIDPVFHEENLKYFFHWIEERYSIHYKKDVLKKPSPWTTDAVLNEYRFTNVRREHDKETLWLINNIVNSDLSLEEKMINIFLFRFWNRSDTFSDFGGPWKLEELKKGPENFRERIQSLVDKEPDRVWFTNVFNTGGAKQTFAYPDGLGYRAGYRKVSEAIEKPQYEKLIPLRPFNMSLWFIENDMFNHIMSSSDQQECVNRIREVPGYGPFLAYQVFVDLTYIEDFLFSENEFTVAGPGCRRGIDLVVKEKNGLSYEEVIFWIRDNQEKLLDDSGIVISELMKDLPEHDRSLNVMSLENCFCEISKYIKVRTGTGRPKVKYKHSKNENYIH